MAKNASLVKLRYDVRKGKVVALPVLHARGQEALPLALQTYIDALTAMKVIDEEGSEYPDWTARLKAADSICDRFGLPKRAEMTGPEGKPLLQVLTDQQIDERIAELVEAHVPRP